MEKKTDTNNTNNGGNKLEQGQPSQSEPIDVQRQNVGIIGNLALVPLDDTPFEISLQANGHLLTNESLRHTRRAHTHGLKHTDIVAIARERVLQRRQSVDGQTALVLQ